jgi:hypothetical protein
VTGYPKPLPVPDADSLPFWEGCARHELLAQRCLDCGAFRWPPRGLCPRCLSWQAEWTRLSGRGVVASFVVVHRATNQAFAGDVPYVIARITLEGSGDQVQLLSNVVGCGWEDVRVGMPVEVVFDDVTPEHSLPKFRPA